MRKFEDIIERIEYVRKYLNLNKSRYSSNIGMKPQTYNNFIGAQGSKPNIELIRGIVNRYGVNPTWLLNGEGEVFSIKNLAVQADDPDEISETCLAVAVGGPAGGAETDGHRDIDRSVRWSFSCIVGDSAKLFF